MEVPGPLAALPKSHVNCIPFICVPGTEFNYNVLFKIELDA